jgi:hypothetical protein
MLCISDPLFVGIFVGTFDENSIFPSEHGTPVQDAGPVAFADTLFPQKKDHDLRATTHC